MNCREAGPLLHARLDNELDMAGSASIDLHLADCRACAAQYAALQGLHDEIASVDLAYAPGAAFERKLAARFLKEPKSPLRLWTGNWLTASAMAAATVGVIVLIVSMPALRTGSGTDAIATEILDDHLRALEPMHQVDVPSSDQHTVKPWFQGKTSFSPPVPDLTGEDFILIGGRLEVLNQQPAAAIVYRRRQHVIDLYVLPSPGADSKTELREQGGYHLLHWMQNNMSYWAVSDVDLTDLRTFADLIRGK
ncbi:MAG TPA: anti-sigma factor [Bryobacteraceae bacterium]|nr:anti-sigma factor [Bryobacteraceae bacterium]